MSSICAYLVSLILVNLIAVFCDSCDKKAIAFDGSCYVFGNQSLSYDEAKRFCDSINGSLATPRTLEENYFLKTNMAEHGQAWLGFDTAAQEDVVKPFTNWWTAQGEPDCQGANCCTVINGNGFWEDMNCDENNDGTHEMQAICEISLNVEETIVFAFVEPDDSDSIIYFKISDYVMLSMLVATILFLCCYLAMKMKQRSRAMLPESAVPPVGGYLHLQSNDQTY
ncbi:Low affinity immunoglobulin epsilon Fc receptor [Halotydeus destructor]|nr:Low affinity immunoglobulin epsilon Fc receptor [Halotydeus destructor]